MEEAINSMNSSQPAFPGTTQKQTELLGFPAIETNHHGGMTKKERFCLAMGVPETGDPELDDIIRKGERKRLAGLAMQGIIASIGNHDLTSWGDVAHDAVGYADHILAELPKEKNP